MVFLPSGGLELVSELGVAYRRDERSLIVSRFLADLGTRTFPACFGMDMNYLDLENYHGGQLVAQLFAQRGATRVAMINGPETRVDAIERERGFFEGLVAAGVKKMTKRYGDFTVLGGTVGMESTMKELTPEAGFCGNYHKAAGAIKAPPEPQLEV